MTISDFFFSFCLVVGLMVRAKLEFKISLETASFALSYFICRTSR